MPHKRYAAAFCSIGGFPNIKRNSANILTGKNRLVDTTHRMLVRVEKKQLDGDYLLLYLDGKRAANTKYWIEETYRVNY